MSHTLSKTLISKKLMLVPLLALGLAASPAVMAKPDYDKSHQRYERGHDDDHGRRGDDNRRDWDDRHDRRHDDRYDRRHDRHDDRRYSEWRGYERRWSGDRYRVNVYQAPRGYYHRQWHRGERLPVVYRESRYVVRDYRHYRLDAPPRGHHWVRVDNDVILTAVTTGVVAAVVYGIFN